MRTGNSIRQTIISDYTTIFGSPPPWFVGVLNVTPDSFSDGGLYETPEKARQGAELLLAQGSHIIDVGAEATGPGSKAVDPEEEIRRLDLVVRELASKTFLSVDTYKATTARHCLRLGARMINDVSALRADSELPSVVREHDCHIVLMHSKEEGNRPHVSASEKEYKNIVQEVNDFFKRRIDYALQHGIRLERIILDPGMGRFLGHKGECSWEVLARFEQFQQNDIPCPLLIGTSRKSFLGGPVENRDPSSQLTAVAAHLKGASFIRTHNVKMAREFFDIWQRIHPQHCQEQR